MSDALYEGLEPDLPEGQGITYEQALAVGRRLLATVENVNGGGWEAGEADPLAAALNAIDILCAACGEAAASLRATRLMSSNVSAPGAMEERLERLSEGNFD